MKTLTITLQTKLNMTIPFETCAETDSAYVITINKKDIDILKLDEEKVPITGKRID